MSYQPHSFVYKAPPLISIQPQCSLQRDSSLWGDTTSSYNIKPLPSIPSINHDQPSQLSIGSSPVIRAIHDSVTELDKQINDSTNVIEERAKRFLEEQDKQIEKLREQNRKNELRNELLRTKKQDMLGEIAELKERQNERVGIQQEREKLRQEREKMQQEIAELKKQQQEREKIQQCDKLDNTMDYCITRRGFQGKDIDSDWVCIGTTYLLKKIEKCE